MTMDAQLRPLAGYSATHFRWVVDADAKVATQTGNQIHDHESWTVRSAGTRSLSIPTPNCATCFARSSTRAT